MKRPGLLALAALALAAGRGGGGGGSRTLLPGHGPPWRDGVESAVDRALAAGIS